MNRPLLITDCDEVLLHMVRHMSAWLDEAHAIDFWPHAGMFAKAARRRECGTVIDDAEMWTLLDGFFAEEMARQTLVPHAGAALERIAEQADIVILTNLGEHCLPGRIEQLAAHGIRHRVICNGTNSKGAPVAELVAEYRPSAAVFVDDMPLHHASVARHAPDVFRLHMIAEPRIAGEVAPAPAAHVRIDDWADAVGWIIDRFEGRPLPAETQTETHA